MNSVPHPPTTRTNGAKRKAATTKCIPAPPDSKVSRKRLRLAPVAVALHTVETVPQPLPASSPLVAEEEQAAGKPRTHADDLADFAAEILVMIEEIENALSQAALDVDGITTAKNMIDAGAESLDARIERFTALRGKIDHELLTSFRWVAGLRALARFYTGCAERECAA